MDGGIIDSKVGVVELKLEYKEGKLVAAAELSSDDLLDLIEKGIPGDWDRAPIAALKALLKK